MKKILSEDIDKLNLDKKLKAQLKEAGINTVLELCNYSRMELVELGIKNAQTNDIAICLQLAGVDLKKNHAKKNKSVK